MKTFSVLLILLVLVGCSPAPFKPFIPPKIEFDKTENYTPSKLVDKPQFPKGVTLDTDFQVTTDPSLIKYIAYTHEEFKKLMAINTLAKEQRKIIDKQVVIIQRQINTINDLSISLS